MAGSAELPLMEGQVGLAKLDRPYQLKGKGVVWWIIDLLPENVADMAEGLKGRGENVADMAEGLKGRGENVADMAEGLKGTGGLETGLLFWWGGLEVGNISKW